MGDFYVFGLPVALGTMIYQAAIFTVLVFLLKKFVLKKVVNVMETRKQYIEKQLKLSEKYKLEAEKVLEDQNEMLRQARKDAREMLKHSEIEAKLIIKDAKAEAKLIIKEAKEDAFLTRSRAFDQKSQNKGA